MELQWDIEEGIGWLKLNQPPSNTMTIGFFTELRSLVKTIKSTPGLKAVIICGMGRHFSSGAEINELLLNINEQVMLENYRSFVMLEQLDIPVISAIRGVCIGSAFELALFSHFRICSEDAVLGLPESNFNLMPGIGGIRQVARLAGTAKAIEITLRGNTFPASDAFAMGLVDAVVPKGELLQVSLQIAKALPDKINMANRSVYLHKYIKPTHAKA